MPWWSWIFWSLAILLALAAAVSLYRALFQDRSRNRRRCPRCWYDMSSIPGLTCPECGRESRHERALLRTRRHWRKLATTLLLVILAYSISAVPVAISSRNWWAVVPRPLLCAFVNVYDDDEDSLLCHLSDRIYASRHRLTKVERLLLAKRCGTVLNFPPSATPPAAAPPALPGMPAGYVLPPTGIARATSPRAGMLPDRTSRALDILSDLRADAWPATSDALELARNRKSPWRRDAVRFLATLKPPPPRTIAALADLLKDGGVCGTCMDALGSFGPASAPYASQIRTYLLASSDTGNAPKGLDIFRKLEGDAATLTLCREMLATGSAMARVSAARAAALIPEGAALIPEIVASINDPRAPTGARGVRSLRAFGPAAWPALTELAASEDPEISVAATDALNVIEEARKK